MTTLYMFALYVHTLYMTILTMCGYAYYIYVYNTYVLIIDTFIYIYIYIYYVLLSVAHACVVIDYITCLVRTRVADYIYLLFITCLIIVINIIN